MTYARVAAILVLFHLALLSCSSDAGRDAIEWVDLDRGICVVLGDRNGELSLRLARETELLIYLQLETSEEFNEVSCRIDEEGLFGVRVFLEEGALSRIHLADNLADRVLVVEDAVERTSPTEVLQGSPSPGQGISR